MLKGRPAEASATHNETQVPSLESGDFVPNEDRIMKSTLSQALSFLKRLLCSTSPQLDQKYAADYRIEPIIKPADKYKRGYGQVAAYLASDPNFLIVRKFEWLHDYVLLYIQEELQELEAKLEALDKEDFDAGDGDRLRSRRRDPTSANLRSALISKILDKLKEYGDMVLRTQNMQGLKRPSQRDRITVAAFIFNKSNIVESEAEWIRRSDDLGVVSRDIEHSWLSGFVEDVIAKFSPSFLRKVLSTKEDRLRSGDNEDFYLTSSKRINALIQVAFTPLATLQFLVPLLISYIIQQIPTAAEMGHTGYYQILNIYISCLFFSAFYSFFSTPQLKEVFVTIALYCATQVVLLGNANNAAAASSGGPTPCAI